MPSATGGGRGLLRVTQNITNNYEGGGQPLNPYHVANFNAIGDGVTDDTTAIRNAITAAEADDRGQVIEFAHGKRYKVSGTLTLGRQNAFRGNNCTFVVEGNTKLLHIDYGLDNTLHESNPVYDIGGFNIEVTQVRDEPVIEIYVDDYDIAGVNSHIAGLDVHDIHMRRYTGVSPFYCLSTGILINTNGPNDTRGLVYSSLRNIITAGIAYPIRHIGTGFCNNNLFHNIRSKGFIELLSSVATNGQFSANKVDILGSHTVADQAKALNLQSIAVNNDISMFTFRDTTAEMVGYDLGANTRHNRIRGRFNGNMATDALAYNDDGNSNYFDIHYRTMAGAWTNRRD